MTEESANENFLLKSLHKQKNALTLHPHLKKCSWCGSSAWLEYMPVTHGVAGSSPVRTATNAKILTVLAFFYCLFACNHRRERIRSNAIKGIKANSID